MIEYEELRGNIDCYLMKRLMHRKPLVCLTVNYIIVTRRNGCVNLYLRIRRIESRFSFIRFLKEVVYKKTYILSASISQVSSSSYKYPKKSSIFVSNIKFLNHESNQRGPLRKRSPNKHGLLKSREKASK